VNGYVLIVKHLLCRRLQDYCRFC